MKQYMKRVMLVLCMVACLFSLSACSASTAVDEEETLNPQMEAYFSDGTEGLLETITSMDKAEAEQSEEGLLKQKEAGLASGVTSWINVMHDTGAYSGIISSTVEAGRMRPLSERPWHSLRTAMLNSRYIMHGMTVSRTTCRPRSHFHRSTPPERRWRRRP